MEEVSVETGVDALIALLESRGKLGIKEASDELKIDESFVQAWVDFLVEEKIIGIEYKFTKPYIFLNSTGSSSSVKTKSPVSESGLSLIRKSYFDHAKEKRIPEDKAKLLWAKHLQEALDKKRTFFFREAKKRNLANPETLFNQYSEKIMRA